MSIDDFLPAFERMLDDAAPLEVVRAVEAGGGISTLWTVIEESGFLDVLVPEDSDGAGLSLGEVAPLIEALGAWLVPAPVAQTMAARALLAAAKITAPPGSILLASIDKNWQTPPLPFAEVADYALLQQSDTAILVKLTPDMLRPTGLHASRTAALAWTQKPEALDSFTLLPGALHSLAAVLRAAEIAGMAAKILDMTINYANERVQFGKPIGKQQAVQQQLAVVAEQTILTRMAGRLGCAAGLPPVPETAAMAKCIASMAVPLLTGITHAVHGAIGISEEYNLQLYTRRLHEYRLADGSETYWATKLGAARLTSSAVTTVDFIRANSPI